MIAQGFLLVLVGVWLLLQTLAGDLPARVLSLRHAVFGNASATTNPSGLIRVSTAGAA